MGKKEVFPHPRFPVAGGAAALGVVFLATLANAQDPSASIPPSLKSAEVPAVVERITGQSLIPNYVVDVEAAIRLGKARHGPRPPHPPPACPAARRAHRGPLLPRGGVDVRPRAPALAPARDRRGGAHP